MITMHVHRPRGPTGRAEVAFQNIRVPGEGKTPQAGLEEEIHAVDPSLTRRLRPLVLRKLQSLLERSGELPPSGNPGALLPPFSLRFMADELCIREAQVHAVLSSLVKEGTLVNEGDRYRVPEPDGLLHSKLL